VKKSHRKKSKISEKSNPNYWETDRRGREFQIKELGGMKDVKEGPGGTMKREKSCDGIHCRKEKIQFKGKRECVFAWCENIKD